MKKQIQWNRYFEIALLVLVLVGATAFRLWQLDGVPPGLHYDEAIDLRQALNILEGERPIYVSEGWGREALYYYLVAGMLLIVPSNLMAIRLTVVILSLVLIVLSYVLGRRFTGQAAALFTAAWLSVNFWSLFTSRFAVRGMTLAVLLTATAVTFWQAWESDNDSRNKRLLWYGIAGFLFGLSMYTYQPARFVPFIFILFFAYLAIWHRPAFREHWRGFVLFMGVGLLTAVPLIIILLTNDTELDARGWLIEPLTTMLAGDFRLVWQNGIATLKMFTFSGDPLITDNVPGRPVFVPVWTGLFFYVGFALTVWRWRQPKYAFLLAWFFIMLAPTVLTASAPNYNRIIAAQTAVMLIAAIPIAEAVNWVNQNWGNKVAVLPLCLGLVAIGQTGWATWHDYFVEWPQFKQLSINYAGELTPAAQYLNDEYSGAGPVVVNTAAIEDVAPYITSVIVERPELDFRWVDTAQAIAMPDNVSQTHLIVTKDRWIDDELADFIGLSQKPAYEEAAFSLYNLEQSQWQHPFENEVHILAVEMPGPSALPENQPASKLPLAFENAVALNGFVLPGEPVKSGETLTFFTDWQVLQDGDAVSLAFFVHMLNEHHEIVAQQDGLGYPPHSWHEGDRFLHMHRLQTNSDLNPGRYWITMGLYRRETGQRWQILDQDGALLGDRLVIGQIEVGE